MIMEKYGTCCSGSKHATRATLVNIWLDESFYLKRGDHTDTKLTSHNFPDVGHQFRYEYLYACVCVNVVNTIYNFRWFGLACLKYYTVYCEYLYWTREFNFLLGLLLLLSASMCMCAMPCQFSFASPF